MAGLMAQSESSAGYEAMTPLQTYSLPDTPTSVSLALQMGGEVAAGRRESQEPPNSGRSSQPLLRRSNTSKKLAVDSILKEDSPRENMGAFHFKRFIIFPGSATGRWYLELWDIYITALVLLIAYFEPFAMALYAPHHEPKAHAFVNLTFNISFTVDMIMQFFISTQHSQDSIHKDLWEKDISNLAKAYCAFPFSQEGRQGWFWIDLVTVMPSWYTMVLVDPSMAAPWYLLRIVRLFQTARLARLAKLSEVLHAHYGFPFFVVDVLKFVAITTVTCHWIACVWVAVEGKVTTGLISYSTAQESWLSALIKSKGDHCVPDAAQDPCCVYVLAYYWAAMTLTSVGYGDITPQNKIEYLISVACMFVVGYIWAYIVGTIVSILSNLDPSSVIFKRSLDDLGKLMRRRGLSHSLQVRLRTYMHETRHFMQLHETRQLVEQYFSDGLQREIAAHSAEVRGMLRNVYWMRELQEEAILDIVRGFRPRAYGPKEHIILRGSMILMQRGIAGVKGRVLSRGDVWGQNDILMETPQLIDSSMPRTLSFVELLMLTKSTLVEVGHCYPRADRRLRRAQIRTATARAFIYQANRIRAANKAVFKQRRSQSMVDIPTSVDAMGVRSSSSLCHTRSLGGESSFANPGMQRIHLRTEGTDAQDTDLKPLLMEMLKRQSALQMQVSDLQMDVRALQAAKANNSTAAANNPLSDALGKASHVFGFGGGGGIGGNFRYSRSDVNDAGPPRARTPHISFSSDADARIGLQGDQDLSPNN